MCLRLQVLLALDYLRLLCCRPCHGRFSLMIRLKTRPWKELLETLKFLNSSLKLHNFDLHLTFDSFIAFDYSLEQAHKFLFLTFEPLVEHV